MNLHSFIEHIAKPFNYLVYKYIKFVDFKSLISSNLVNTQYNILSTDIMIFNKINIFFIIFILNIYNGNNIIVQQ